MAISAWLCLGELGAIYFTIYRQKPFAAGFFFALAFGNRTEILLTAPIFLFFLIRNSEFNFKSQNSAYQKPDSLNSFWKNAFLFCLLPFLLGTLTLLYNYFRFDSPFDFGYARIPGVLKEPWYNYGIFSVRYIPRQAFDMLFKLWNLKAKFPFLLPNGFGGSIFLSSPFLILLFRRGAQNNKNKYLAWCAILVLTIPLWMHGNSGGWQFSYRYAMILLPWIFLILLENDKSRKIRFGECVLYLISILINAYATYLFYWTNYIKP